MIPGLGRVDLFEVTLGTGGDIGIVGNERGSTDTVTLGVFQIRIALQGGENSFSAAFGNVEDLKVAAIQVQTLPRAVATEPFD